ncbi:MAG: hypothetical protein F6K37_36340 [Moorea sp. SIO4E2]|uniref:hypothetical protein n=1 Tax=Moorena sp. SIO4E2 TaxID=2607826 RepID=UPI0013BCA125|nr:hypothetical protein [Moorena sp. SIO4E2]NEQ11179.1 hypothetical protein [Moorena sp. SIO4E2]
MFDFKDKIIEKGFLTETLESLDFWPDQYYVWREIAQNLPNILPIGEVGIEVDKMPQIDTTSLEDFHLNNAKLCLGMIAQAYVWEPIYRGESEPRTVLPAQIAIPFVEISERLEEPPILNYADYVLRNWRKLDPNGDFTTNNLRSLVTFSGRQDEDQFITVHVAYEAAARECYKQGIKAMELAQERDAVSLAIILREMADTIVNMKDVFMTTENIVSAEVFRKHIRQFLKGWNNNVELIYEGTEINASALRGETGSQSSAMPFLDRIMGCMSLDPVQREILNEKKSIPVDLILKDYYDFVNYMPAPHRKFLEEIYQKSQVRSFVIENGSSDLVRAYNNCVGNILLMRTSHFKMIPKYISNPGDKNNTGYGTGGTSYVTYLGTLRNVTESAAINSKDGEHPNF